MKKKAKEAKYPIHGKEGLGWQIGLEKEIQRWKKGKRRPKWVKNEKEGKSGLEMEM